MHPVITSAVVAAALLFPQAAASQTADASSPFVGTWKLDPAASKFTSGPAMTSETRVYEVKGDKLMLKSTVVDGSGKEMKFSYSAAYDGKYYPFVGNPVADTIALKRVDARTSEATVKKGDKVAGMSTIVVSPDGQRLTMTRKMMREGGEPAVDELVFVKQQ